jgi:epoxide hydrolase-like predicted phosphatase
MQHLKPSSSTGAGFSIRAVIWDIGGVLVRTADWSFRDALAARFKRSRRELEDLVWGGVMGTRAQKGEISPQALWVYVGRELDLSPGEVEAFRSQFFAGDFVDLELIDWIKSLRPSYKLGIITNAFTDARQYVKDGLGLNDALDALVISAEVGIMKPERRIFEIALERLAVAPPEAVFIDDFQHNVQAAAELGIQAVHFTSPGQARARVQALLDHPPRTMA